MPTITSYRISRRTAVSIPSINQSNGFTPSNMRLIVLHITNRIIAAYITSHVRLLSWVIIHPQTWAESSRYWHRIPYLFGNPDGDVPMALLDVSRKGTAWTPLVPTEIVRVF